MPALRQKRQQMASRLVKVLALLLLLIAPLFELTNAQRRITRRRQRPVVTASRIDYSKFLHSTPKHQQAACNTCHRVPTQNWKAKRGFPDVADFPDHDACIGCHRQQFFRGDRPPICSVCHSKVSPRDDVRFAFRNPARATQFAVDFPHDRHQDIIAAASPLKLDHLTVRKTGLSPLRYQPRFVHATFVPDNTYNNCAICHLTRDEVPAPATAWTDSYMPDRLTFKSVPSGHESCFNCHWKAEEPVSDNCNGCHKLAMNAVVASSIPQRISMKFKHDGGGEKRNHVAECTTCHINITKASSLRGLKPDVPITACTECHNREGLRLDLSKELDAIDKDRAFVCVYCHTSDVGRRDPPASHYSIVDRPPQTRGN